MEQDKPCLSKRRSWFQFSTPIHLTSASNIKAKRLVDNTFSWQHRTPQDEPLQDDILKEGTRKAWPASVGLAMSIKVSFLICLYLLGLSPVNATLQCPTHCVCPGFEMEKLTNATAGHTIRNAGPMAAINCSNMGLDQVTLNLSSLQDLNMVTNFNATDDDTSRLDDVILIPSLQFLDLSHNMLMTAEPVIELIQQSPKTNPKLHAVNIDLSHNDMTEIKTHDFIMYTGVSKLDLSYNKLQNVEPDAFHGLATLNELNLSHNAIQEFGNETLCSLVNLRVLDLSHNRLHLFPIEQLHELSSLQYLYLNNNKLHQMFMPTVFVLFSIPKLIYLDLSNNQLEKITNGMFSALPSLRTLDLTNCSIQELTDHSLAGLTSLEELRLDQNDIPNILGPVFQNTPLKRLSITFMPALENICHDAFLGLSQLKYLNISHNPAFGFVQPNLLAPLANLQVLDLSHSNLTHISEITFHNNKKLMEIHLQQNPLSCSCVNGWLAREATMNQSKFWDASSLSCQNETGQFSLIQNAHILCEQIRIYNMSSEISAKLGSQLLLQCQYDTDEPSVIVWTTPRGKSFYHHHFHPDASQHLLTPKDIQLLMSKFHKGHYWHDTSSYHSELDSFKDRIVILSDGSLYIDYMMRTDTGSYRCEVSNAAYNHSSTVSLFVDCEISTRIKIFGIVVGLLSALGFFTLNVIYVIISWIARRLVNKRRREIIRQMLENLNAYKSAQVTRIQENYTYQLSRVRNQYHIQRDKLHRNYTSQVTRMKRGCSNQVERVRDNYNFRLNQLRDYSSNQIMQIRERANNQIVRIRDYGSSQLDKLRETYKLQQQHVLKLLDTMNLDNCRNVVETECMRTESMMYDIDLLGDDERTESPVSHDESEYNTAASSPGSSLDDQNESSLKRAITDNVSRELSTDSSEHNGIIIEMQTTIDLDGGLTLDVAEAWKYDDKFDNYGNERDHEYSMNICSTDHGGKDSLFQLRTDPELRAASRRPGSIRLPSPLPTVQLDTEGATANADIKPKPPCGHGRSDSAGTFMTPEASPTKVWPSQRGMSHFQHLGEDRQPHETDQDCYVGLTEDSDGGKTETKV